MANSLDKENHGFNKRNAEAAERTAERLGDIDDSLIKLAVVLEDIRDVLKGIREGSQHD